MKKKIERIIWIDVAKFLGIFAVYLGHFSQSAGKSRGFVFCYHVALFFFISGCTSNYDNENNFFKYILKKIKTIMVPFWGFSLLALIIYTIQFGPSLGYIKMLCMMVLKGNIRNRFISGSLWFLSCLFVMEIFFKLLKYLKSKTIIFIVCLLLYLFSRYIISPTPIAYPHWYYNVDSACNYIIYFALGYILYPYFISWFKLDNIVKKVLFYFVACISGIYAIILFDGNDLVFKYTHNIPYVSMFVSVYTSMILILFNLIVAKFLENITYFSKIGKETLYLCGNEYVVKTLVPCVLEIFSLKIVLNTPLHTYIYSMILLIIAVELLIPAEKKFVSKIFNKKITT